jgi:outer membrane protein assembly factor BamB
MVRGYKPGASAPLWQQQSLGPVRAVPLYLDSRVFVPCAGGGLYALSADTGEVLWHVETSHPCWTSPIAWDHLIWVGSLDGWLFGIRPETGAVVARYQLQMGFFSSFAAKDSVIYWGAPDGTLCAFDLALGKRVWSRHTQEVIMRHPVVQDGVLLVQTSKQTIEALDRESGCSLWSKRLHGGSFVRLTASQGKVFVCQEGGEYSREIACYQIETGEEEWALLFRDSFAFRASVATDNALYVAGRSNGYPTVWVIAKEDGEIMETHSPSYRVKELIPVSGRVYVVQRGGRVDGLTGFESYAVYLEKLAEERRQREEEARLREQEEARRREAERKAAEKRETERLERERKEAEKRARQAQRNKSPDDIRAIAPGQPEQGLDGYDLLHIWDHRYRCFHSDGAMFRERLDHCAIPVAEGSTSLKTVKWERKLHDGMFATPVSDGSFLYLAGLDGSLYALESDTGRTRWHLRLESDIWSTPAIVGNWLFVGCDDGFLYLFDKRTGRPITRFQTGGKIRSSPVVADGFVYFGSYDGRMYCLRLDVDDDDKDFRSIKQYDKSYNWEYTPTFDGELSQFWSYQADGDIHASPAVYGKMLVFGCAKGGVYAVDRCTGTLLWKYQTGGWIYSSPAVRDGVVYVGSDDHCFYVLDGMANGRLLWKVKTDDEVVGSPAVTEESVYFGGRDGYVYAYDRLYGTMKWKFRSGNYVFGAPVVVQDALCFTSADWFVYSLNRADGALINKHKLSNFIWAPPGVVGQTIVVCDRDGQLKAFGH